jgi:hypothetical protein
MRKWGDLKVALQLGFWVTMTIATHCNSTYFYEHEGYLTSYTSCRGCNSPYMKPYTCVIHATLLQLYKNNYYATLMQLVCNYHHDVMLTLLFIDLSKFDM